MNFTFLASPEDIEKKFGTIKKYRHSLYSFFSMMPKGGDLHHHYSGSLYTETYVDFIIKENYFINSKNLIVLKNLSEIKDDKNSYVQFKDLSVSELNEYRYKLLREWSIRDFTSMISNDEHFFNSFTKFDIASKSLDFKNGLNELKQRALSQKVSYIESMLISCNVKLIKDEHDEFLKKSNNELVNFNNNIRFTDNPLSEESYRIAEEIIDAIYERCKNEIHIASLIHNTKIERYLEGDINSDKFVITFQNYVNRNQSPIDVFIGLATSFQSASSSDIINGINIVSAENGVNSLLYYNLHMLFYMYFEKKYPNEKYCVHAGELVSGMVKPEHLGIHIKKSMKLKNLRRIGHGVDIIYDNEFSKTIKDLRDRNEINKDLLNDSSLNFDIDYLEKSFTENKNYLVIEINLTSNEFILNMKDDLHPVELYFRNGIPIVVCSDDEGILRTSLTEQFAILTYKYGFTYMEIKKICFDSIRYSHIKSIDVKKRLFRKLLDDFQTFENSIDDFISIYVDGKTNSDFSLTDDFKQKDNTNLYREPKFKGLTNFM